MNYTTITINDQKVGLKFGMASFRYVADKLKDGITFETLLDYIEANIMKQDFIDELKEIIKVWGESDMIKNNASSSETNEESTKKKSSRGRK